MPLSDEFLFELKSRNRITDVVSDYVNLKRQGRNMVGLCPFHGEKTPSFVVYPETESFYCFGCGAGGEVINFIRRIENLDFMEAVKLLADRAGMQMPQESYDDGLVKLKNRVLEANRAAAKFYYSMLFTKEGEKAYNYLKGRALADKTIKHFGLGYAPSSVHALVDSLRNQGFTEKELIEANLAFKSARGFTVDRFIDRVMFPIIDLRGNVIAFGGRIMTDEKPKYLNTSDTLAFKKSHNLFALNFAKGVAGRKLILAEGYMDVIALHQAGFCNAVATLGTSLTEEQAVIMKRYADEVVICYDADEAGQKAASRAITILRKAGLLIRVLAVPGAKDPDEFIREHGEEGQARFRQLLENSANDVEYRLNKLKKSFDLTKTDGMVAYLTEAAKILAALDNSVEAELYASKLSEEAGLEKQALLRQMKKYSKTTNSGKQKKQFRNVQMKISGKDDKINTEKSTNLRSAVAEEALIAYIINNPDCVKEAREKLPEEKIITDFNRRIYKTVTDRLLENRSAGLTELTQELTTDECARLAALLARYTKEVSGKAALSEYINVILSENDKKAARKAVSGDVQAIQEYIQKLKDKKQ